MVLLSYDIWVTFFNGAFFKASAFHRYEAPLLKLAGVKIVAVPYGSDVALFGAAPSRFDWLERWSNDCKLLYQNQESHNERVAEQVAHLSGYSDYIIGGDYSLTPFLPRHDLNFKYYPIDCEEWKPRYETENPVPVIVHASNHRNVKGTDILIQACERLKKHGLKFELKIIEQVPRSEVQEIYRKADILADQFIMGAYGLTALEGLAVGKPVLTYLSEEHLRDPVFNLPIVNTNLDNIDDVLKVLIGSAQLRQRLGIAGRQAVVQYQSCEAVGEVWDRVYRHLWFGDSLDLHTTRIFGPDRLARSLCEDPREPEFWPVDVSDLMVEIQTALSGEAQISHEIH
jgi:glycosyltransferase involved in cell wall biosynthesis